jgi:acyl carrier protein
MTRAEAQSRVLQALAAVAPETAAAPVAPDQPLRTQVDLDSMDFLRFIVELHKQLGVTVPERDYGRLATLNAIIDYVMTPHYASGGS